MLRTDELRRAPTASVVVLGLRCPRGQILSPWPWVLSPWLILQLRLHATVSLIAFSLWRCLMKCLLHELLPPLSYFLLVLCSPAQCNLKRSLNVFWHHVLGLDLETQVLVNNTASSHQALTGNTLHVIISPVHRVRQTSLRTSLMRSARWSGASWHRDYRHWSARD